MPFESSEPTEEFIFVNKEDPDGKKGLRPFSWNLETEPVEDGNEGTPKEKRRVKFGPDGEPIRIARDDPRYSIWFFALNQSQMDRDAIDRKVSKTSFSIDRRKARKMGRNYSPEIKSDTIMSAVVALLTTMSRGWRGSEFFLPIWWKDKNKNRHPLAGTLSPCSREWIEQRNPIELAAAELFCNDMYEPESDDDEEAAAQNVTRDEFLASADTGVDRSEPAEVVEA